MSLPASSRRRFLSLACGGAAFWLGYAATQRGQKLTEISKSPLQLFEKTGDALGTQVSLRVLHENESIARQALHEAFEEIESVERVMSLYRADSQLVQLNRTGRLQRPHPYLMDVLAFSRELSRKSSGAFDVTVQPLWDAYVNAARVGKIPSSESIEQAKSRTGWEHLEISNAQIRFNKPGMAVTLNGVAQGFAADKALEALRAHGIRHALVDAGEFSALGRKAPHEPWRVGIQHPRHSEQLAATIALGDRCLSTSGDYETFFTPDFAENHIFDPRNGHSPRTLSSVSVLAPNGLWADGLSTALFVLGGKEGAAVLKQFPGCSAYFMDKQCAAHATPGFSVL